MLQYKCSSIILCHYILNVIRLHHGACCNINIHILIRTVLPVTANRILVTTRVTTEAGLVKRRIF